MGIVRRLPLIALSCALAQLTAGPSLAASGFALVQLAAHKGTHDSVPDATAPHTTSPGRSNAASEAKALKDCMAIWDTDTHISKSKWKEICRRQLKERSELSGH